MTGDRFHSDEGGYQQALGCLRPADHVRHPARGRHLDRNGHGGAVRCREHGRPTDEAEALEGHGKRVKSVGPCGR